MDQELANQSPAKQVLDLDSMEEDETLTEPIRIEEYVQNTIKGLQYDIFTQKNYMIVQLENDVIKGQDDIYNVKSEVNDLKSQVQG